MKINMQKWQKLIDFYIPILAEKNVKQFKIRYKIWDNKEDLDDLLLSLKELNFP